MNTCFVVSAIGSEGSEIRKRADQVLKYIIQPVCERSDFEVIRVDRIHDVDMINETIISNLKKSDLVIADLTNENPNAFFEIGYRTALNKPLIQLMEEHQRLPFDVAGTRTIFYQLTDPDKIEKAKDKLYETIKTVVVDKEVEDVSTETNVQSNQMNQVFSLLLDIKDGIENLANSIKHKDKSDIEGVLSAFANQMQKNIAQPSTEEKLMEIMLPELMNNPEKMVNFMTLAAQFGNPPKK